MRFPVVLCLAIAVTAHAAPPVSAPATEPSEKRFGREPTAITALPPFAGGRFEVKAGETIVFAGQANLVREQETGWLEAQLAVSFAGQKPRFRTMAWEGDTVYSQWRDLNFGGWGDQLSWAGATSVVAQFGQMEALDGLEKLPEFVSAYHKLIDEWSKVTGRIVLVSPMPFEKPAGALVPDHSGRNRVVRAYAEAVRKIAGERRCVYVDLYGPLEKRGGDLRLTSNGIHLTPEGHRVVAEIVVEQLGGRARPASELEAVRQAVVEKDRLWFENWRPMNWAFAYGDRQHVPFGHEAPGHPMLRIEFEEFKPLIVEADRKIQEAAAAVK